MFKANKKDIKILTEDGYKSFAGVKEMGVKSLHRLVLEDGSYLDSTADHKYCTIDGTYRTLEDLQLSDIIITKNGSSRVKEKIDLGKEEKVYDLIQVEDTKSYFANKMLIHNCEFVSSDETLIEPMFLAAMKSKDVDFYTGKTKWFDAPKPNHTYLVALDPSLGTGSDDAAIQVFEIPSMVQVAEWQNNNTPPRQQVSILLSILQFIFFEMNEHPDQEGDPQIFWTIENNTLGEAVLQVIQDTGEYNFPGRFVSERRRAGATGRRRKGLNTNKSNKLTACSKMKSLIETNRMTVNSNNLLRQLKFFVSNGASYAAKSGEHDDLIMAALLCVRMLGMIIHQLDDDDQEEFSENVLDDDSANPLPTLIG